MTNQIIKNPRQLAIEKGKKIVIAIIAGIFLFEFVVAILQIPVEQTIRGTTIVRFGITVVLCIFLYQGKNWAKSFLAFGFCLGAFIGIYGVWKSIIDPTTSFFVFVLMLLMTTFYATSAYCLIFSSSVDEFVSSQKV